jgi:hypothetical protein
MKSKYIQYAVWFSAVAAFVLLPILAAFAGTPREKAIAAVAVARAALDIADELPVLEDKTDHFIRATPQPLSHQEFADLKVKEKTAELVDERRRLIQSLESSRDELERLQEKIDKAEAAKQTIAETIPAFPETIQPKREPLRVEFAKQAVISETLPAQLVIGGWVSGCPHCERLEREVRKALKPLRWTIGNAISDQIQFTHIPQTEAAPQIVLYQNGVEINRWTGYQDPAMLSRELRSAWDTAADLPSSQAVAAGPAGAIKASAQIKNSIDWFRSHVGEGVKASIRWDRSGAQSFPLLAHGDWSATAIFGRYGHMELAAPGAKDLPIDHIGFGYKVDGDDLTIDLDNVTLKGLAKQLSPNTPVAAGASQPSQLGVMTAWTIVSILRDVWSLLHPTCDLQLGGNVTATAVLQGDVLTVDFQQAPSVKLVALFTFNLGVQRVTITEKNVHIDFSGSRLVKSRDFSVQ